MPATKKCYDNALLFWKDNSSRDKLPLLSQMAEIYLGISSSSVPSNVCFHNRTYIASMVSKGEGRESFITQTTPSEQVGVLT
jgi:hypothetical protein